MSRTDRLGEAIGRLRDHPTHADITKRKIRDVARILESLSESSRDSAERATLAAMGPDGPPTPEFTRRETWEDRPRLLAKSNALSEIASALRCSLAELCPRNHR